MKLKYVIGIDTQDEGNFSYCLSIYYNGKIDIIMSKVIHDWTEFNNEVINLSKYFGAEIIGEFS